MKNLFLLSIIAVLSIGSVNAQEFKAGVNAGLVTGDFSDLASFNLALDVAYLWDVADQIQVGAITGFSQTFTKEVDGFDTNDVQFLPIAAAGRFAISDQFTIGTDLGYAVGINDGNDGGFYYAPRVQYSVNESLDIVAAYRGVSIDAGPVTLGFNTITLGVEFAL
ncbi:hypothetical protein GCM10022291_04270 [Postechiella marina]|uniref:Outer membrane protein beta-barrel domain-containing protein n=1 Tax=Postechiella marina TaxID=943941 RepID=A0ABP8C0P9_9FLAO